MRCFKEVGHDQIDHQTPKHSKFLGMMTAAELWWGKQPYDPGRRVRDSIVPGGRREEH